MSQDIIADALNEIMNAKRAKKQEVTIKKYSKLLIGILDILKENDYLNYKIDGKELTVKIKNLNMAKAIKPRYTVSVKKINFYVRRFLPARDFGFIIISTSRGLMKDKEAEEKNLGGCLIAYVY